VTERLGGNAFVPVDEDGEPIISNDWEDPQFHEEFVEEYGRTINDPKLKEADENFTSDLYDDTYLNMEVTLQRQGAEVQFERVMKQLREKDGLPIGTAHDNPILDTRMNKVEFHDGHKALLVAKNAIAENLFAQIDNKGNRHVLFQEIWTINPTASKSCNRTLSSPIAPGRDVEEKRPSDGSCW
jgi:hypothetical protein